jgi:hypothetical protein
MSILQSNTGGIFQIRDVSVIETKYDSIFFFLMFSQNEFTFQIYLDILEFFISVSKFYFPPFGMSCFVQSILLLNMVFFQYLSITFFQWDISIPNHVNQIPIIFLINVIFCGILILFFVIILFYRSFQYFPKLFLYLYGFFLEVLIPIEFVPLSYHIGFFLHNSLSNFNSFSILFVIVFYLFGYVFFFFFIHSTICSFSPYVSKCPIIGYLQTQF